MDTILRNAKISDSADARLVDIGIENGRIAAIEAGLEAEARVYDLGGQLATPGFVETHIHLDKSRILDRLSSQRGGLDEAIDEVTRLKADFTPEDVYARAKRTLEKCVFNGATHMRTHLEVDPVIGLRSLEGILPLVQEFKWAMDIEICIFPQEGLLNNPGADELMSRDCGAVDRWLAPPLTPTAIPGAKLTGCLKSLASSTSTSTCISISDRTRQPWTWTTCATSRRVTTTEVASPSAT